MTGTDLGTKVAGVNKPDMKLMKLAFHWGKDTNQTKKTPADISRAMRIFRERNVMEKDSGVQDLP